MKFTFISILFCLSSFLGTVSATKGNSKNKQRGRNNNNGTMIRNNRSLKGTKEVGFRVYETTSSFYQPNDQPKNYAEVEQFCDDKRKRLCTLEELCPFRPDYPSHLAFREDMVSPDWPMTDSDQWVAYRRQSDTSDGCTPDVTSNCNSISPNYWVQVGTSDVHNVCQTHCENDITMACPPWGIDNAIPAPYQSFVICCDGNESGD